MFFLFDKLKQKSKNWVRAGERAQGIEADPLRLSTRVQS